jgi:phosphatidylglycerophosphatase A
MRELFLTFFYSGLLPKAPGTYGTIAGAIVGVGILAIAPVSTLLLLTILLTIIAIKEIDKEERESGIHDASKIVIDEVAGIWLAFTLSSETWLQIILSVLFFRLYDIWKPSIIGKIDRDVDGGLGVMGDDIIAGIFAGLSSSIIYGALLKMGLVT